MAENIITRDWTMKAGTEVPAHLDGQTIRVRVAGDTTDRETAMDSMLALAGGSVQAVLDTFNSAAALAFQKEVKAQATDDSTVEQLQQVADSATLTENRRGGGGGGKKARVKAKAEKMDQVENKAQAMLDELRATDPDEAARQEELFRSLGLI